MSELHARELVPIDRPSPTAPNAMIAPLVDARAARQAIEQYEELKAAIAIPSDYVRDAKGRTYLKKSFWRRIARCFGLSVEVVREERTVEGDGTIRYTVTARATAPNGQSMDGDGLCTSREFGPTEHNVRAKACTRARNRAISDLVGGGEVSADELPLRSDLARRALSGSEGQPQRPPPAATGGPKTTWGSLRKRALAIDIATQEQWETLVRQVTGKRDPKSMNSGDLGKVEATIAQREAEISAANIVDGSLADDNADDNDAAEAIEEDAAYDLEELDVPEVKI